MSTKQILKHVKYCDSCNNTEDDVSLQLFIVTYKDATRAMHICEHCMNVLAANALEAIYTKEIESEVHDS